MHKICTSYGQVQRIVIFKKNGVQAMVEYPFWAVVTILLKEDSFFLKICKASKTFCPYQSGKKKLESDWYSESFDAYVFILKLSDSQPNTSIKLKSFKRKFTKVLRCFTKI